VEWTIHPKQNTQPPQTSQTLQDVTPIASQAKGHWTLLQTVSSLHSQLVATQQLHNSYLMSAEDNYCTALVRLGNKRIPIINEGHKGHL